MTMNIVLVLQVAIYFPSNNYVNRVSHSFVYFTEGAEVCSSDIAKDFNCTNPCLVNNKLYSKGLSYT